MVERQEKSQTIVLGKQTISGTKSTSSVYKNPKAEVEIYNKNLKINLEKNITKLKIRNYQKSLKILRKHIKSLETDWKSWQGV